MTAPPAPPAAKPGTPPPATNTVTTAAPAKTSIPVAHDSPPEGGRNGNRDEANAKTGSHGTSNAPAPSALAAVLSDGAKRAAVNTPPLQPRPARASESAKKPESKPIAVSEAVKKTDSKPPAVSEAPKKLESNRPALDAPPRPADRPHAGAVVHVDPASEASRRAASKRFPPLLSDPVPHVMAILVSSDRRLAAIDDGRVIGIGDVVGKRVVVGIDDRTVLLREPSGVQIRVGLGGRLIGVERTPR